MKKYRHFEIGQDNEYFNDESGTALDNKAIIKKVSEKCYIPATKLLLKLLRENPKFRVSFSFTGVLLEQLEEYSPKSLALFQEVMKTGQAEILSETYYHSLSYLYSETEFKSQVALHKKKIKALFGVTPKVFRNTELIYDNRLALIVESMGYKGILTEGADHILGWRSPNFLYKAYGTKNLSLLLKNYRLSDDIAFRFGEKSWSEWPLTPAKFARWVSDINGNGEVVNLFMDYETLGEHQWEETGIFDFLEKLPEAILAHPDNDFVTPSEALARYTPVSELSVVDPISWADVERDLSAWLGNAMQTDASRNLYSIYEAVIKSRNKKLLTKWRLLTTSDHFYYMCTKWFSDGDVHKYFNPYETPYDAFRYFMNALTDLKIRVLKTEKA